MWSIAGIDFVIIAVMGFHQAAEHGVAWFQCYEPQMGKGGRGMLIPLSPGIRSHVDHFGFASFVFGCDFILPLPNSRITAQQKPIGLLLTVCTV